MAKAIMIQGAGSNVGKSLVTAGLARAAVNRGISVAPFKPQNMSNNAAVTADGGEIGRAQALQARAARREPVVDMNPVLLKPEAGNGAQIVICGRRFATASASEYAELRPGLLPRVEEKLQAGCRHRRPGACRRRRQSGGNQPPQRGSREHGLCRGPSDCR